MKRLEILIISVILIAAFFLRLYKITNPIADWHSWRQTDTAAVARNFIKEGFNILYPRSDSLTPMNEYGLENPNRYFINEFPLYNLIVAFFYQLLGINPIIARLVSIVSFMTGTFFLYLITRKLVGFKVAVLSTLIYATLPYNIYYGRVIMPDPAFIALSLVSFYLALKWIESKKLTFCLLTSVFFALAILTKPYAIFLYIPILFWLYINWKKGVFKNIQTPIFIFSSIFPYFLWRIHMLNNHEGTFATSWLFNAGNIRFTGAFFRWLIFERASKLIFATGGFVLFIIGLAKSLDIKNGSLLFVWFLSLVLYVIIFAKGNVTHDYYQMPLVPIGAIFISIGFFTLLDLSKKLQTRIVCTILAVSLLIIIYAFGWYEVRGYFNINRPEIVEAGMEADKLLPKDAIVIAPYNQDPTFLYQTNRYGYTAIDKPLSKYLEKGARYLVSVDINDLDIRSLIKNCNVIKQTNSYAIIEMYKECIEQF